MCFDATQYPMFNTYFNVLAERDGFNKLKLARSSGQRQVTSYGIEIVHPDDEMERATMELMVNGEQVFWATETPDGNFAAEILGYRLESTVFAELDLDQALSRFASDVASLLSRLSLPTTVTAILLLLAGAIVLFVQLRHLCAIELVRQVAATG